MLLRSMATDPLKLHHFCCGSDPLRLTGSPSVQLLAKLLSMTELYQATTRAYNADYVGPSKLQGREDRRRRCRRRCHSCQPSLELRPYRTSFRPCASRQPHSSLRLRVPTAARSLQGCTEPSHALAPLLPDTSRRLSDCAPCGGGLARETAKRSDLAPKTGGWVVMG